MLQVGAGRVGAGHGMKQNGEGVAGGVAAKGVVGRAWASVVAGQGGARGVAGQVVAPGGKGARCVWGRWD